MPTPPWIPGYCAGGSSRVCCVSHLSQHCFCSETIVPSGAADRVGGGGRPGLGSENMNIYDAQQRCEP